MRQNTVFSTKNTKTFLGRGTTPPQTHLPRRLDPVYAEILGTPLEYSGCLQCERASTA